MTIGATPDRKGKSMTMTTDSVGTEIFDKTGVPVSYRLEGLPQNLIFPPGDNKAPPFFALIGLWNRETRKDMARKIRRATKVAKSVSDDDLISNMFLSQGTRLRMFWESKENFKRPVAPINDYYDAFGPSIVHSLIAKYDPDAFSFAYTETEDSAAMLKGEGIPIDDICASLTRALPKHFDKSLLGFIRIWPLLLKDLAKWDLLTPDRRNDVANAIFSLSSALNTPIFMARAVLQCQDLMNSFTGMEDDELVKGSPSDPVQNCPEQDDRRLDLSSTDAGQAAPEEDWNILVANLNALAARMAQEGPSSAIVGELHVLTGRFEHVPLPSPVTIGAFQVQLQQLFHHFEDGEYAQTFAAILSDVRQIFARWQILAHGADEQQLTALYDDIGCRVDEVSPHEAEYIKTSLELDAAITACEEAQRRVATAPLAKKMEMRAVLKEYEGRRNDIDDRLTHTLGSLFAALNFKGEPFDAARDWSVEFAALVGSEGAALETHLESPKQDLPSPVEEQYRAGEPVGSTTPEDATNTPPPISASGTPIAAPAEQPVDQYAYQKLGAEESASTPLRVDANPALLASSSSPSATTALSDRHQDKDPNAPSPIPSRFWALIGSGEYGLAYNLAVAAGPTPGLPLPNAVRLLVLGTELSYPQGATARAMEEAVKEFDPERDLANLSSTDSLAANLLLVAATVRSGLLAPGTGGTDIVHRELSLGAGWDHLHKLTQIVAQTAHQMHGAIFGPDAFRQRKADKTLETARDALKEEAQKWLDANSKSRLPFRAATNIWHSWVSKDKDARVYKLLAPMIEPGTSMTAEWRDTLSQLADPAEVEAQVQECDRKMRGNRYGNIDYKALDQLQRRVVEAVHMIRQWMSFQVSQPKTDFVDRNIKALDQRLEELKSDVFVEVAMAQRQRSDLAIWTTASCLQRELEKLYSLFDPEITVVPEERAPLLALNGDLLLLPSVHLDAANHPDTETSAIRDALLSYEAGSARIVDAAMRKMDEGDFDGAERLSEQAAYSTREGNQYLIENFESRLAEARAALKVQHADTLQKLEGAFRSGLISDTDRDQMMSVLTDIEGRMKEIRRIDSARSSLAGIVARIAANSAARMGEVKERFIQLALPEEDARHAVITKLLDRGDALAAEEYIDHVARGETPPSRDQTDEAPSAFATFLSRITGTVNLPEIETVIQQGKDWGVFPFASLSEAARQDAVHLLSVWNSVKRLKRTAADPNYDPAVIARLLSSIGFRLSGPSDVTLNSRTVSRLDLTIKVQILADRRVCPAPEFGSEAKGRYRVICVYPKTGELEATEITPSQRGATDGTIVLFMGQLSREGRQKLLRQKLQARRSWLVVDEILLLHLAVQAQGRLRAMFAATLPYTITDPYRIKQAGTVPPEMFFGRAVEREAIIAPQGASFVYGGRQLGKTVLLKEIERLLHDPTAASIVQWVDLPGHGVGRSSPPETLWTIVVRELFRFGVVSIDWPDFRPSEQKHVARVTEDIRTWLEKHPDGRILLLMDEADEFLREDATEDYPVTRQLKALMERTDGRFKSVFVGLHNVLRSTLAPNNPLVHLGAVEIGPLYAHGESRAAFEMVLGPISALGYVFADDSLIMRILAACNYYPNLINLFCRKLLEKLRNRADAGAIDPSRGYYLITEKLVSEIYESTALRDDIRHYFLLTLQLDTRYELIANWLAMEYLQKRMNSAEGIPSLDIRTAARALWPEGFRGTTDQEFDALLMEMVGLGVLRRTDGNQFTFRNPNVLQLMGTAAEIDDRLTKISVEGELKPGFDATTFRGPMPSSSHDARRSPLTITQEAQICTAENGVLIVCGATMSGLSDLQEVISHRHAISHTVATSALTLEQAKKDLDSLRSKAKAGINVLLIPETRPWAPEWITHFCDNLKARVSTTSFIRAVFEAGPGLLWSMAKDGSLGRLDSQSLIVLKPWTDPYLWIWLEDMNLPPSKALRKAILEATDGRPGLLMQLHANLDAGAHLQERIDHFMAGLLTPDRARAILVDLGVLNDEARKGLSVMKELPGETVAEIESFWPDMGPSELSVQSFVRWAELLSLVRPVGTDRWEVEPFVAKLLATIEA